MTAEPDGIAPKVIARGWPASLRQEPANKTKLILKTTLIVTMTLALVVDIAPF